MAYRWKKLDELQLQPNYEKKHYIILFNVLTVFLSEQISSIMKNLFGFCTDDSEKDDFLIFEDLSIYLC